MTWDAVALPHVGDDHRLTLRSVRELRCHSCAVTLVLPRDPGGETPTPPPFEPLTARTDLKPMPSYVRAAFDAHRAARRASRLSPTEQDQP